MAIYLLQRRESAKVGEVESMAVRAPNSDNARAVAAKFSKGEGRKVWSDQTLTACILMPASGEDGAFVVSVKASE